MRKVAPIGSRDIRDVYIAGLIKALPACDLCPGHRSGKTKYVHVFMQRDLRRDAKLLDQGAHAFWKLG